MWVDSESAGISGSVTPVTTCFLTGLQVLRKFIRGEWRIPGWTYLGPGIIVTGRTAFTPGISRTFATSYTGQASFNRGLHVDIWHVTYMSILKGPGVLV